MKNVNLRFASMAFVALLSMFIISCDKDENSNGNNTTPKRIKQILTEEWNSKNEKIWTSSVLLEYDSNGRVIRYLETLNSLTDGDSSLTETTYNYFDDRIIQVETENREYKNGYHYFYIDAHVYKLKDGLVTTIIDKNGKEESVSYDENGYIKTIKYICSEHDSTNYVWKDGFLLETDEYNYYEPYVTTFSYSNIAWPKSFVSSMGAPLDGCLWDAGYFGKRPSYLSLGFKRYRNTDKDDEKDIFFVDIEDYSITDGLITKMVCKWPNKSIDETITSVSTFIWE